MFLFKCCQEIQSGVGYQIRKPNAVEFTNNIKEIDQRELTAQKISVFKIKKSEFEEISNEFKKNKQKFIDHEFPAQYSSLGQIQGVDNCTWKRISDLITNPVLMGSKIEPNQVVQGSLGDCYFLSALAALAEDQNNIRAIFEGQSFNHSGIYKVTMRIHGELEEVLVDDFIPVNENGQPLFCQPYRNEFWVLILEKAWAKVNRSYANILMGTPTTVFKSLTLAPAELLIVKQKNEEKEKIWNTILDFTAAGYPIVCSAREDIEKNSYIQSTHSYTLIGAAVLEDSEGTYHKVVKLRDPWGKEMQEGIGSTSVKAFWSKIIGSHQRKQFEKTPPGGSLGVFYLPYNQFCLHFSQIHYCLLSKEPNYNSEPLFVNKKNGSLFQLQIVKKGLYSFSLHQSEIIELVEQDKDEEGMCRATLVLIKKTSQGPIFVNGILKYNEQDTILTENLEPGSYLLFAKIDPTRKNQLIPLKTVVGVYSPCFTVLRPVEQLKYPDLFRQMFLNQARGLKKNLYNNGLMWISWKLLLQQGGYAYIGMGVDRNSNKKFVIDFSQQEFNRMNFHLKGRFKGQGNQRIEVLPGQEQIILARVNNQLIRSLKFPPNLGIKMELVPGQ